MISALAQGFFASTFIVASVYVILACFREPQESDWKPALLFTVVGTLIVAVWG